MTDNSTEIVDIPEDLEDFTKTFYNVEETTETSEAPEEDTEDDALATEEDTDASQEDEDPEAEEDSEEEEDTDEDESEDESDEESEPEPKKKDKGRKSYQERINELTRARRESERREAALIQRLEQLEARERDSEKQKPIREQLPQNAPQPNAVDDDGEPLYPLGELDPLFIRDLTKFTIDEETRVREEKRAKEEEQRRVAEAQASLKSQWSEKLNAAEEEIPEIREHIADLVDSFSNLEPAYGEFIAVNIMQCDNGPAIMEYLSQNIGEAQKIVASGAAAAAREIGRLDALLSKPARPETEKSNKKVSGAPKPPEKATRGVKTVEKVRPDTADLAAFKREFFGG